MEERMFCKCIITILCIVVFLKWLIPFTRFGYCDSFERDMFCSLNQTSIVMQVGEREKIRVIGLNQQAFFCSSDFKVAEIDCGGNIYAHRKGTAIIFVRTKEKVLKCKVKVISSS